ncbi:1823_t:CDS:2 [Entrophospora sp. SA101]|nr:1823_t:CDS:2 [Entrophospora sp. SA101]
MELLKPEPFISTPSIPNSPWTFPVPNESNSKKRRVELSKEHQKNSEAINLQENICGWALKEKQKFGKKGGGVRMSSQVTSLCQNYFHAGNTNKSDRYSPEDMLNELNKLVKERQLDPNELPKINTIQSWIGRYSANCKRKWLI